MIFAFLKSKLLKNLILFFLFIAILGCSEKESDLVVVGNIQGLKKGTVYLKKMQDTVLVTLDSASISGTPSFKLKSAIEEPEIFYLVLDKNDTDEGQIRFFGNKGITEINTTLKNFAYDAKIKGSPQHEILQEYNNMAAKFNNKNLDILKDNFDALKDNDSIKALESDLKYKSLLKSKYLYTINFALNNKTSQVAPYVALTDIYDARLKYLDTIYISLPDSIAGSKYGRQLKELIDTRKELGQE